MRRRIARDRERLCHGRGWTPRLTIGAHRHSRPVRLRPAPLRRPGPHDGRAAREAEGDQFAPQPGGVAAALRPAPLQVVTIRVGMPPRRSWRQLGTVSARSQRRSVLRSAPSRRAMSLRAAPAACRRAASWNWACRRAPAPPRAGAQPRSSGRRPDRLGRPRSVLRHHLPPCPSGPRRGGAPRRRGRHRRVCATDANDRRLGQRRARPAARHRRRRCRGRGRRLRHRGWHSATPPGSRLGGPAAGRARGSARGRRARSHSGGRAATPSHRPRAREPVASVPGQSAPGAPVAAACRGWWGWTALPRARAPASPPRATARWCCRSPSRLVGHAATGAVSARRSAKVWRGHAVF